MKKQTKEKKPRFKIASFNPIEPDYICERCGHTEPEDTVENGYCDNCYEEYPLCAYCGNSIEDDEFYCKKIMTEQKSEVVQTYTSEHKCIECHDNKVRKKVDE